MLDAKVLAPAAASAEADALAARRDARRSRSVLAIDDDAAILRVIERTLRRAGYEVCVTTSATDALSLLEKGARFDAIVCDMRMPSSDGAEMFANIVRVSPRHGERFVFVTGGGLPAPLEAFLTGQRRLAKPFSSAQLVAAIDAIAFSSLGAPLPLAAAE